MTAARSETLAVRPRPALPATPEQRAAVRDGARQLGLNAEQLGVLAQLLCGERILERVSSEGLAEIHGVVSAALNAGFQPSEFAYLLARSAAEPCPRRAAQVLRRRIAERIGGRAA